MTSIQKIRLLLADDHPVVLQGLISILRFTQDIEIVAAVYDGISALKCIREDKPNIAVLDLAMPGMTGIEVLSVVSTEQLDTRVIILTASAGDTQILAAVAGGVHGIMLKDAALDELTHCIRHVAQGGRWLPHPLLNEAFSRDTGRRVKAEWLMQSLTAREREVMLLVAEGLSNKEVARRLNLSDGTIKIHLHNIYQKVGVTNRTSLAALALTHKDQLLPPT